MINRDAYTFPSIYVEGAHGTKHICYDGVSFKYVPHVEALTDCESTFSLIPYERVIEYIDLVQAKMNASVLVVWEIPGESEHKGFLISRDSSICLQEVAGQFIYLLVSEGSRVAKGGRVAYQVTNKLEVRNVYSNCEGKVAFIIDMTWETPRKVLLVVIPGELREVIVRKGS